MQEMLPTVRVWEFLWRFLGPFDIPSLRWSNTCSWKCEILRLPPLKRHRQAQRTRLSPNPKPEVEGCNPSCNPSCILSISTSVILASTLFYTCFLCFMLVGSGERPTPDKQRLPTAYLVEWCHLAPDQSDPETWAEDAPQKASESSTRGSWHESQGL